MLLVGKINLYLSILNINVNVKGIFKDAVGLRILLTYIIFFQGKFLKKMI